MEVTLFFLVKYLTIAYFIVGACEYGEEECLPRYFNWVEHGAVTPVKDQFDTLYLCNAGYAFATVGALEATLKIWYHQPLRNLSAQEIIDCTVTYGTYGCYGGYPVYTMEYVVDREGINSEYAYPYKGLQQHCKAKKGVYAGIVGYKKMPTGDEFMLQSAIYCYGPAVALIDATSYYMNNYAGGVLYDPDCLSSYSIHGVLVVGWGEEDGQPYWLIKNSWGTSWGEDGYLKLFRGVNNCGIANYAVVPVPY